MRSRPGASGWTRPVTDTSTGSPALRNCSTSRDSWFSPGAGSPVLYRAVLAEHSHHPAHLGQGLPAGGLHRLQGLPLDLLVLAEPAAYSGGLHRHDAEAVTDHVVQLARDPVPLLRDRPDRPLLTAKASLLGVLGAQAQQRPEEPRDHPGGPPHRLPDASRRRGGLRVEADPGDAEDDDEHEAPPRRSAAFPAGHAVGRDHRRHRHAEALRRPKDRELQDVDAHQRREDLERVEPTAHEQQGAQAVAERLRPMRSLPVGGERADPHLELPDDQARDGDHQVEQRDAAGHAADATAVVGLP